MGMLNQDPKFEPFEVVGEAEHSQFPSVIVEGNDDVRWYPSLEKGALRNVYFKAVGGRDNVLACYKLAEERQSRKIVCVADKDLWVIFGCPVGYEKLILTEGYSIENDILKDSSIHLLFSEDERQWLEKCKELLSEWYAFYVYKYRTEIEQKHSWPGVRYVLSFSKDDTIFTDVKLSKQVVERYGYAKQARDIVDPIITSFEMKFRGKNLLELYEIFLQQTTSAHAGYNGKQLIDMSLRFETPPLFQKQLVAAIKKAFADKGVALG